MEVSFMWLSIAQQENNSTTALFGRIGAILALLMAASYAGAVDYFVAASGSDSNDGKALTRPFKTVAKALAVVQAGSTVYVRAGTYRESLRIDKQGTATAPIVISAYGSERPIIKGSQVVTGWTLHSGTTWKKTAWTVNSQQVFDDGVPLQQIGKPAAHFTSAMITPVGSGVATMTGGSYYYDALAKTLYVRLADGSNPANSLIEASVSRRIFQMGANARYIQLKKLIFRHSNASATEATGCAVEVGGYGLMEDCAAEWCDFAGIGLAYNLSGAQLVRCTASNNGDVGIQSSNHRGFSVRDCKVFSNNYRKFSTLWHAGGMKFTTDSYGTVEHCDVYSNRGTGIWFDWCDSGSRFTIDGNNVHDNSVRACGIMTEGSKNGLVMNNIVSNNDERGIYISCSDTIKVCNNTVVGQRGYSGIDLGGMPRTGKTLSNISVYNNVISRGASRYDISIIKENGTDVRGLICDYNCVWRSSGAVSLWNGLDARGGWSGTTYSSLTAWRNSTPYSDNCVQADPQFTVGSGNNYSVNSTSPNVNSGLPMTEIPRDFVRLGRPLAGRIDRGAFER
jgi:parallel beta-helix repeat protein